MKSKAGNKGASRGVYDAKPVRLNVPVSEALAITARRAAKREGITLSEWVRRAVSTALAVPR
jgi:predicted HicB family RNase H-like nuclease